MSKNIYYKGEMLPVDFPCSEEYVQCHTGIALGSVITNALMESKDIWLSIPWACRFLLTALLPMCRMTKAEIEMVSHNLNKCSSQTRQHSKSYHSARATAITRTNLLSP